MMSSIFVFISFLLCSTLYSHEVVLYKGKTMMVVVPESPLAKGSLKIEPKTTSVNLLEWSKDNEHEAYELIQKVVKVWKEKGVSDYLIYTKGSSNAKRQFSWEIVPFEKSGLTFWKQFKVLWNITFGSNRISENEREQIAKEWTTLPVKHPISVSKDNREDAFCNPDVIKRQLVYEGKEIYLLYNYAPISTTEGRLHFLLIPKKHRLNFSELTESEYSETNDFLKKLISYYRNKDYHIFDKNGSEAGQSVPHWHEHLVFTDSQTQEFLGKLIILKNMLIGTSPLSNEELENRVRSLRKELHPIFEGSL